MSRSRQISLLIVFVLANYLVLSNLVMLLFAASTSAVSRPIATRVPRMTFTPTAVVAPTSTETPPPTATTILTKIPTTIPTPFITVSATRSPTLTFTYPFTYTVKSGDTLSGLASRFSVSVNKIMAANALTDPNTIRIGQVLIIPDPNQ